MPSQRDFTELVDEQIDRSLPVIGDALAAKMGPPAGGAKMSSTDEDKAWSYSKGIDYEQRALTLAQQIMADPNMQGLPDEMIVAEVSVRLTDENHPYWRDVYTVGMVSPSEMAEKAERVRDRVAKKQPTIETTAEAPEGEAY